MRPYSEAVKADVRRRMGPPNLHHQASPSSAGDWLSAVQQLWLVVQSVMVPKARNLMLNPLHPAIAHLTPVHQVPFRLDQRLAL